MPPTDPLIIIRKSRWISLLGLVIFGGILLWQFFLFDEARDRHAAYFIWIFFAAGMAFFYSWQLIQPDRLEISSTGVKWSAMLRSRHWSWADIDNFRVIFGTVGCDTASDNSALRSLGRMNKKVSGSNGSLGGGWEGGAANAVQMLTAARTHWLCETPGDLARAEMASSSLI